MKLLVWWDGLKKRDFFGNTGRAIKNSSYNLATTLIAKFGSLIFTVIIARLLMPELYGLYGLALSTILFLSIFSDMGIRSAINTFVARTIDKKTSKARAYFWYFIKFKFVLVVGSSILILISANFFANVYYQKPIYLALFLFARLYPSVK